MIAFRNFCTYHIRTNLDRDKQWSHQIVRVKNRRNCKNFVFARSVLAARFMKLFYNMSYHMLKNRHSNVL